MMMIAKCPMCEDSGERPVADVYGEFDVVEFCSCPAGDAAFGDECQRIDAIDHVEFDAHYAHEAWVAEQDRRAASEPFLDLNEPPF